MATPEVAGAAALLLQCNSSLTLIAQAKFSKLTSSAYQNIEMIQAHTKLGKSICEVIKEFCISFGI